MLRQCREGTGRRREVDPSGSFEPVAMAMALRDMGNGVTRIEAVRLSGRISDQCCATLECVAVVFPLSARLEDAVQLAFEHLVARGPPAFTAGCFRHVTDFVTEFYFW